MQDRSVRAVGLILSLCYATFILWLYVRQPQSVAEAGGSLAASIGVYRIDQQAFAEGLELFKQDRFEAARAAFARADPAALDARTQFYIAYSYYRSGWGRLYQDDAMFGKGLEHLDKAIALAPGGRLVVDDPDLGIHDAHELRAELVGGRQTDASDFNPLRVFRKRR